MFRITNRHNTVIWEGEAYSFYDAWNKMFEACKYPMEQSEKSIVKEIELGMWIERVTAS